MTIAKTTAQTTQINAIITALGTQLEAEGAQDLANSVIPQLQNLENSPNLGSLALQGNAILAGLIAVGPQFSAQAIAATAGAVISIIRVYVPPASA